MRLPSQVYSIEQLHGLNDYINILKVKREPSVGAFFAFVCEYASFLEQLPTAGLFVPMKDGRPLERPFWLNSYIEDNNNPLIPAKEKQRCADYIEAYQKVIFSGWKVVDQLKQWSYKKTISNGFFEIHFLATKPRLWVPNVEDKKVYNTCGTLHSLEELARITKERKLILRK